MTEVKLVLATTAVGTAMTAPAASVWAFAALGFALRSITIEIQRTKMIVKKRPVLTEPVLRVLFKSVMSMI